MSVQSTQSTATEALDSMADPIQLSTTTTLGSINNIVTTIVVPLDGSPRADQALRPACALARRIENGRLLLLSCGTDDLAELQAHLDRQAERFSGIVTVDTQVVASQDPASVLLDTTAAGSDTLLCMSTTGRGALKAAVLGSVADTVVSRSGEPVTLVGPECRMALLPDEGGRALVCSDGSSFSENIIPCATSWSAVFDLEPWVAEVVPPDEDVAHEADTLPNRQVEAATARLRILAERLTTPAHAASFKVLHGAPASRSLVSFADELPAALIVMATHGRTGFARLAVGSFAGEVIRQAPCPVLVERPRP